MDGNISSTFIKGIYLLLGILGKIELVANIARIKISLRESQFM